MISKFLYTLVAILFLSTAFGKEKSLPETTQVIAFSQLDTSLLQELLAGKHPEIAIQCDQGTLIPIQFFQSTELFNVHLAPNLTIQVQKTCYVRIIKKSGYISFDLESWENTKHLFSGMKPKVDLKIEDQSLVVESNLVPDEYDDEDDSEDDDDEEIMS